MCSHASAERFDPRVGTWEWLPDMSVPRGYCAAAFGAQGTLFVHGGIHMDETHSDAEWFDPRAGRWHRCSYADNGADGTTEGVHERADHSMAYIV
jgi:hypothetical protein